jgi:GT2 family glycosyltransferase
MMSGLNPAEPKAGVHRATIMIVTRNRKETVRNAVESAFQQEGDNEVLVVDDGSADGTVEYLRQHFPLARILSYPEQEGYIVRRNQGCQAATGTIVFSIDDDAVYADTRVVLDTLKTFDDPQIAVAMIPHINYSMQNEPSWYAPVAQDDGQKYVTHQFIGTAYAIRRDVFNRLGGFQNQLFHWWEEAEFSQRLLNAGYVVVMGTQHRIRHYPNPAKYDYKLVRIAYRNVILGMWYNAPLVLLIPMISAHVALRIIKAHAYRWVSIEGTYDGLRDIPRQWSLRKPVRLRAYLLWLKLRKNKMLPMAAVRDRIPKPRLALQA